MHCHLLKKINSADKISAFNELNNQIYKHKKPSKRKLMELVDLPKSTYYDSNIKKTTLSKENKIKVQERIVEIFEDSGQVYGANKLLAVLEATNNNSIILPSRATISRYMREIGLKPIISTRFNIKNCKEKENKFIHNNYLKYWKPICPGTHFVTDITYIYTKNNGWVYLLTFMDLFTRQIVEFDLNENMDAIWVTKILNRLIHDFPNVQLIHSDRGTQYKSEIYMKTIENSNIIQSYSKKGYPYDNAWIESFHKSIKQEKLKHFEIPNMQTAFQLCCEYILTFYNSKRIHSAINYLTPNEFCKSYSRKAI